jgi:DNA-binding transcriptional LysR family regulator
MSINSLPSPSELKYFIEVAKCENMSRAAERLGIAQPSLTQAMKRLEHTLDTPLFQRHKKGVTLTKAGQQLYVYSHDLVQNWDNIYASVHASVNQVQGSFIIGCHPSVARTAGAYFLPKLMEAHKDLHIRFHHDLSRHITNEVITMNVDIGIVVNPTAHPDLIIHQIGKDYISLWIADEAQHPLQNPYNGEAVLICDPQLLQSQSIIKQLTKNKIKYSRIVETSDLNVISELTAHGGGIGIMPESTAQKAKIPLKRIGDAPAYDDKHCLIYRVENKNIKALQVISEAIRSYYQT